MTTALRKVALAMMAGGMMLGLAGHAQAMRYVMSNGFAVPDPYFTQTEFVFVCIGVMLVCLMILAVIGALKFALRSFVRGANLAGEAWVAGKILEKTDLPLPKSLRDKR